MYVCAHYGSGSPEFTSVSSNLGSVFSLVPPVRQDLVLVLFPLVLVMFLVLVLVLF